MGEVQSVATFLARNRCYAFEIEFHGKSALSYACCHDQTAIAALILEVGVNSDQPCANSHTSLFYALSRRNVPLVRQLLQKGACPWSTPDNPYRDMLESGPNSPELRTLFNNARKVYLGMQIQSTIIRRKEYWRLNRGRIREDVGLAYEVGK